MTKRTMPAIRVACLALALAGISTGQAAHAQAEGVYKAGAERIAASDSIRSLSQQIAVSACLADAGINTDAYHAAMQEAVEEYDALFAALSDGDSSRGIDLPEEDRKMNVALRRVSILWDLYKPAVQERIDGATDLSVADYISRQNLNIMHSSKYLVSEVINRYSVPPALLAGDAFTLDIVARQRSLAFQIAKESCGVLTGNTVMGKQSRLRKATQRFDISLGALINGLPGAGVAAAPTPAIRDGLTTIQGQWETVKATITQIDGEGDTQTASDIHNQMAEIATAFDTLVLLYVEESKAGIN